MDPSEDPENIEKYWLRNMYDTPPDLVFVEQTGFPASMKDPESKPEPDETLR
jgi:hypothetical protein